MQFNGSWSFVTDPTLIPDGDNGYHITSTSGDFAEYSFQGALPSTRIERTCKVYQYFSFLGSSVAVAGVVNSTAGLFNVSLVSNASSAVIEQQQLSGFSPFLVYTTLFTASGLDPTAAHTLTITNIENRTLALNGLNVTVVAGGTACVFLFPFVLCAKVHISMSTVFSVSRRRGSQCHQ